MIGRIGRTSTSPLHPTPTPTSMDALMSSTSSLSHSISTSNRPATHKQIPTKMASSISLISSSSLQHLSQNAAAPSLSYALIEAIALLRQRGHRRTARFDTSWKPSQTESPRRSNRHRTPPTLPSLSQTSNVKETQLLPNYPNPFNPDTWIPYQLSEASTVTVKIYDVTGSLIRTINVGHKPIGYYLTRERAIYWDGQNQNRESVSSGVYFYTLNTDTYTQTRRMVILK